MKKLTNQEKEELAQINWEIDDVEYDIEHKGKRLKVLLERKAELKGTSLESTLDSYFPSSLLKTK